MDTKLNRRAIGDVVGKALEKYRHAFAREENERRKKLKQEYLLNLYGE